jgi:MFS family permease
MILASRLSPNGFNATVMSGFTGLGSLGFLLGPLASVGLETFYNKNLPESTSFFALSTSFGLLEIIMVLMTIPLLKKIKIHLIHAKV